MVAVFTVVLLLTSPAEAASIAIVPGGASGAFQAVASAWPGGSDVHTEIFTSWPISTGGSANASIDGNSGSANGNLSATISDRLISVWASGEVTAIDSQFFRGADAFVTASGAVEFTVDEAVEATIDVSHTMSAEGLIINPLAGAHLYVAGHPTPVFSWTVAPGSDTLTGTVSLSPHTSYHFQAGIFQLQAGVHNPFLLSDNSPSTASIDLSVQLRLVPIPEPSGLALAALGSIVAALLFRCCRLVPGLR